MNRDYKKILLKDLLPLFLFGVIISGFENPFNFLSENLWLRLLQVLVICAVSVYSFLFNNKGSEKVAMIFALFVTMMATIQIDSSAVLPSLRTVASILLIFRIAYIINSGKDVAYALVPSAVATVIDSSFALYALPLIFSTILLTERELTLQNKSAKKEYNIALFAGIFVLIAGFVFAYFMNRDKLIFSADYLLRSLYIIPLIFAGLLFALKNIWKADKAGLIIASVSMLFSAYVTSSGFLTRGQGSAIIFPLGLGILISSVKKLMENKKEKVNIDPVMVIFALTGMFITVIN